MNRQFLTAIALSAALCGLVAPAVASPFCGKPENYEWLTASLNKEGDQKVAITDIQPSALLGVCEVTLSSGGVVYTNAASQAVIAGNLFIVDKTGDLISETSAAVKRNTKALLADIPPTDFIAFKNPIIKSQAIIYAMVDTDCYYCRKLQEETPALNAQGVEVRYLPYVRGGEEGTAYRTMNEIWCGDNREAKLSAALTEKPEAKPAPDCSSENVLKKYQALGNKVQLRGTPHIMFADGTSFSGYKPAKQLAEQALAAAAEAKVTQ